MHVCNPFAILLWTDHHLPVSLCWLGMEDMAIILGAGICGKSFGTATKVLFGLVLPCPLPPLCPSDVSPPSPSSASKIPRRGSWSELAKQADVERMLQSAENLGERLRGNRNRGNRGSERFREVLGSVRGSLRGSRRSHPGTSERTPCIGDSEISRHSLRDPLRAPLCGCHFPLRLAGPVAPNRVAP